MPLSVQLLPTSPGDTSGTQSLTTFLIGQTIALDAGSLGLALPATRLADIAHVLITHSHLDHLASLPIALADAFPRLTRPVRVYGSDAVLAAIRDHLMNGVLWPDFTKINLLGADRPCVELVQVHAGAPIDLDGVRFTPVPVNHEVPTFGYIAETPDAAVAFTSDTGRTDDIWAQASRRPQLKAVFVDCSFPDEMEDLAVASGHMTPRMVAEEARKLTRPAQILCVHIKPDTRAKVLEQLAPLARSQITPAQIGHMYTFG